MFDRRDPGAVQTGARHPRNNPDWPEVGITVEAPDAIGGTPVLDIKPYVQEYAPRGEVHEPAG